MAIFDEGVQSAEDEFFQSLNKKIIETLSTLKTDHRQVLYLRFYKEMPCKYIAMKLNLNINTVHTRIKRAKKELARISRLTKNYKLTNNRYVTHILELHGPRITTKGKSKFVEGFNIKDGIRSTLTSDSVIKNNTNSREGYIFIKNFNKTIGYDGKKSFKKLKVVLSKDGYVTTAYPMK